jgi:SAM-dependent methyltransferase
VIYLKKNRGPRKLVGLVRFLKDFSKIRRFESEAREFESKGGIIDRISIHLNEDDEFAGNASGQYFWQDLIVAQWVLTQDKEEIVDIGSRVDGYVSNIASSRKLSVIDIRPMHPNIPNVHFIQGDILNIQSETTFDIVTSLHTIEHIGLGRYGDPIDPLGHERAFAALAGLVSRGGNLVVSFPISIKTEVEFNGQRKIGFKVPLFWANGCGLELIQFLHLDSEDKINTYQTEQDLGDFNPQAGTLGIYFFKKVLN